MTARASDTNRERARVALKLVDTELAYINAHQGCVCQPPLWEALRAITDPPAIWARCARLDRNQVECGRHLAKLRLDQELAAILPVHKETPAFSGGVAQPWLDRANADKGNVDAPLHAGLGTGTLKLRCRCGHDVQLRADRRMRLYLTALSRGDTHIRV